MSLASPIPAPPPSLPVRRVQPLLLSPPMPVPPRARCTRGARFTRRRGCRSRRCGRGQCRRPRRTRPGGPPRPVRRRSGRASAGRAAHAGGRHPAPHQAGPDRPLGPRRRPRRPRRRRLRWWRVRRSWRVRRRRRRSAPVALVPLAGAARGDLRGDRHHRGWRVLPRRSQRRNRRRPHRRRGDHRQLRHLGPQHEDHRPQERQRPDRALAVRGPGTAPTASTRSCPSRTGSRCG